MEGRPANNDNGNQPPLKMTIQDWLEDLSVFINDPSFDNFSLLDLANTFYGAVQSHYPGYPKPDADLVNSYIMDLWIPKAHPTKPGLVFQLNKKFDGGKYVNYRNKNIQPVAVATANNNNNVPSTTVPASSNYFATNPLFSVVMTQSQIEKDAIALKERRDFLAAEAIRLNELKLYGLNNIFKPLIEYLNDATMSIDNASFDLPKAARTMFRQTETVDGEIKINDIDDDNYLWAIIDTIYTSFFQAKYALPSTAWAVIGKSIEFIDKLFSLGFNQNKYVLDYLEHINARTNDNSTITSIVNKIADIYIRIFDDYRKLNIFPYGYIFQASIHETPIVKTIKFARIENDVIIFNKSMPVVIGPNGYNTIPESTKTKSAPTRLDIINWKDRIYGMIDAKTNSDNYIDNIITEKDLETIVDYAMDTFPFNYIVFKESICNLVIGIISKKLLENEHIYGSLSYDIFTKIFSRYVDTNSHTHVKYLINHLMHINNTMYLSSIELSDNPDEATSQFSNILENYKLFDVYGNFNDIKLLYFKFMAARNIKTFQQFNNEVIRILNLSSLTAKNKPDILLFVDSKSSDIGIVSDVVIRTFTHDFTIDTDMDVILNVLNVTENTANRILGIVNPQIFISKHIRYTIRDGRYNTINYDTIWNDISDINLAIKNLITKKMSKIRKQCVNKVDLLSTDSILDIPNDELVMVGNNVCWSIESLMEYVKAKNGSRLASELPVYGPKHPFLWFGPADDNRVYNHPLAIRDGFKDYMRNLPINWNAVSLQTIKLFRITGSIMKHAGTYFWELVPGYLNPEQIALAKIFFIRVHDFSTVEAKSDQRNVAEMKIIMEKIDKMKNKYLNDLADYINEKISVEEKLVINQVRPDFFSALQSCQIAEYCVHGLGDICINLANEFATNRNPPMEIYVVDDAQQE